MLKSSLLSSSALLRMADDGTGAGTAAALRATDAAAAASSGGTSQANSDPGNGGVAHAPTRAEGDDVSLAAVLRRLSDAEAEIKALQGSSADPRSAATDPAVTRRLQRIEDCTRSFFDGQYAEWDASHPVTASGSASITNG